MNGFSEHTVVFSCGGSQLTGILSKPERIARAGVLIVVGGPQYRVGSHRQFVLLARSLSARGVAVMRFDYRGMGDSEGEPCTFEDIGEDIRMAREVFVDQVPELESVIIWGLCDAASAALLYAYSDNRLGGLVLINPWVRTDSGEARTLIKNYYAKRMFSRELWGKIIRGQLDFAGSLISFTSLVRRVIAGAQAGTSQPQGSTFPERMCEGLERFDGPVLFVLSGNQDFVADEFRELIASSRRWKSALDETGVTVRQFPEANHTFSRAEWRKQVENWTFEWLESLR